jgi:hypothetical protein
MIAERLRKCEQAIRQAESQMNEVSLFRSDHSSPTHTRRYAQARIATHD